MAIRVTAATQSRKHLDVPRVRHQSTLGDLVVALTDETSRFVHDEEEVYRVVAYMVTEILFRSRVCSRQWH